MRALVTGASGFVGGHLVEHLLAASDPVIGMSQSGRWPPELSDLMRRARLERCDLVETSDQEFAERLARKQPEVIYHLAAWSNPQKSAADPRGAWTVNLGGAMTLFEGLQASGLRPRVVIVGTGVSYGNPAPEDLPVSERCPLRPNNPYAASKAAVDLLALQHHLAHGVDVVIARPFNHAGTRQVDTYVLSSFARQVAEVELGRRSHLEVGNLEIVRDFTDVRDIVRAYRLLAERGRSGEVYNIGTGRDVSLAAMLEILRGLARVPVEVRVDPARVRPVDQPRLLADASKLRADTGWEPQIPLERTLADMLDHWRRALSESA